MNVLHERKINWLALRQALKLTQKQFADLIGVTIGTVAEHERHPERNAHEFVTEKIRRRMRHHQCRTMILASGYDYPYKDDWKER